MWLVQNLRKLLPSLWNDMRCATRRREVRATDGGARRGGADALVSSSTI